MRFQSASPVRAARQPSWRSRAVLALLATGFVVMLGRAVYLQAFADEFLKKKGESRYSRVVDVPANRGRILDRNGEPLAVSTPVRSIAAIPKEFDPTAKQLGELAKILEMPARELTGRVAGAKSDFAYLRRQVAPDVAAKVEQLGIPGVDIRVEYRRYYPGGEVMAQVLGFTGRDDIGQEGIERAFHEHLAGKMGSRRVIKDGLRRVIEDVESVRPAREGRDLTLALDSRIQSLAHRSLGKAMADHKAASGSIVVLDTTTGEVLALTSLPAYNPNNLESLAQAVQKKLVRNRVVSDTFEPGSTLKPFTVAIALEQGKISANTTIQTAPGTLTIGTNTIRDAHPAGLLTVAEIIQKSSNVGTAKIGMGLASESMWSMFDVVGFGTPPKLGFLGEASGRVRPLKTWKPIEQATMSYGHGISVSLIHLARAYTVFAREGDMVPISLTKVTEPVQGKPVVSAKTALEMRNMLELAVQPGGTAPRAQIMGYRVGGKTGTARKLDDSKQYTADKHVASFVGIAPLSRPRLVVAVMIDEPRAGQYYGGVVAAPVFAEVMAGALRILGISPDAPMKPVALPPAGAEVKEST